MTELTDRVAELTVHRYPLREHRRQCFICQEWFEFGDEYHYVGTYAGQPAGCHVTCFQKVFTSMPEYEHTRLSRFTTFVATSRIGHWYLEHFGMPQWMRTTLKDWDET